MSRRATYDPAGPRCRWCGDPCGRGNPARTFLVPDEPALAMTPVCGEDCDDRPAGSVVFNYYPLMVGHGQSRSAP